MLLIERTEDGALTKSVEKKGQEKQAVSKSERTTEMKNNAYLGIEGHTRYEVEAAEVRWLCRMS